MTTPTRAAEDGPGLLLSGERSYRFSSATPRFSALNRYAAGSGEVAEGILYQAGAEFVTREVLTLNGARYLD